MVSIASVEDEVRARLGLPLGDSFPVMPSAFARALGLTLKPVSFGRSGLYGRSVYYCDTAPPNIQAYQIARHACAYVLEEMGLLRVVSPHDLAVQLCAVSCADQQAAAVYERDGRVAEVRRLR